MSIVLVLFYSTGVAAAGVDMSATFATLRTCTTCINAGYGWCPIKRRCGGFANKQCGVGPEYVAPDYAKPKQQKKRAPPPPPPPLGTTDMRATFAKLRDCGTCVSAGYGWCPMQRKCGGFANKQCGIGANYVAADAPPQRRSATPPRNGLWERSETSAAAEDGAAAKQAAVVNAPPRAEVPPAAPPPPASVLYAGPAGPAAPPMAVTVGADGTAASARTVSAPAVNGTATPIAEAELLSWDPHQLVAKILELQSAVGRLSR